MGTTVLRFPNADLLARGVAARLAMTLVERQSSRPDDPVSVVLTGGSIATRAYAALRESALREAVDWSRVHLWWGDERFLPSGHPDRNETQARQALLDDPAMAGVTIHPMPSADGLDGPDPDAAAARYADALATEATTSALPAFDLLLLGIGPDGHVASIFPDHPSDRDYPPAVTVVAVRDSPKPPPTRLSLTLPVINTAREIWLIASGASKAGAVARGWAGPVTDEVSLPVARVHGRDETVWLVDRAAHPGEHSIVGFPKG